MPCLRRDGEHAKNDAVAFVRVFSKDACCAASPGVFALTETHPRDDASRSESGETRTPRLHSSHHPFVAKDVRGSAESTVAYAYLTGPHCARLERKPL